LASLLDTAWGILLQKYNYCNCNDVIFGTTVSGRNAKVQGIEEIVGLFINTLPLRIQTDSNEKTVDFLYRIDKELQIREAYETTSLVKIKDYSEIANKEELFDSIMVIENYPLDSRLILENSNLSVESYAIFERTHYDLTLGVSILDGDIAVNIIYNRESFAEESIVRMAGHFNNIFREMLENPGKEVFEMDMLQEEEKNRILYEFNDTNVDYPKDKTIHQLFEEQVDKTPASIAVVCKNNILTYNELNKKANRVAIALRARRVKPNHIVGIMLERSIGMTVGILGILKAGAAYLPIDAQYPDGRKRNIMQDSHMEVLLTQGNDSRQAWYECEILDIENPDFTNYGIQNPEHINQPNNLVYIIFTSGSTGKPKGTGVYHRGFLNLMNWFVGNFEICACDSNLLLTSLSFDLTQKNIYAPLITGGTLYIPDENYYDPRGIKRKIEREKLTWINCTPRMFYLLVDIEDEDEPEELSSLRYVFLGGEPINVSQLVKCIDSAQFNAEIINTYGPTECTDICCSYRLRQPGDFVEKKVPLGKPVYNSQLFILDRYYGLQPIGVPGELCIGGAGVGIGYLNDYRLTAEKFITFSPKVHWEKRVYRTGDLARWLPDGNIEFLGRLDHQVKMRGFRIEPGEIEHQLLANKELKEAVVTAKEEGNREKYLCAYIVPDAAAVDVSPSALREYLSDKLVDYMIPAYFVAMEKLPLTPNGKIDLKALPEPEISSDVSFVAPRNKVEKKLAEIWASLLDIDKKRIGIDDNFFHMGGHSLKVILLMSRVHKELNVKLNLAEIFKTATIRKLSECIKGLTKCKYVSIEPAEKKEFYGLSSVQKRLYILQQTYAQRIGTTYNISSVSMLVGEIAGGKLEDTFRRLIERHESLRTSFEEVGEEPVQRVHDHVKFELEYYEYPLFPTRDFSAQEGNISAPYLKIIDNFVRTFVLYQAPLLRVGLIKIEEKKHFLVLDMHHIIIDGISITLFLKEFLSVYQGEVLPPVRLRYRDYSEWWNSKSRKETIKKQEKYWLNQFDGELPVLDITTDYGRSVLQTFEGKEISLDLGKENSEWLYEFARQEGTTVYMVLLTLYNVLLSKVGRQEDIIVGIPVLGRSHPDLEQIIGMFVNTLALRNFPGRNKTFNEFFREVKERAIESFENQDYQLEDLLEKIVTKRNRGRNPLFDVMFDFLLPDLAEGMLPEEITPDLKVKFYKYERRTAKVDFILLAQENNGRICLTFQYSANLYKEETMVTLLNHYKKILGQVIQNSEIKIKQVELMDKEEAISISSDLREDMEGIVAEFEI
jgi:amino acid adenylation domain-containing protein